MSGLKRRVNKDLVKLQEAHPCVISPDALPKVTVTIAGPPDTPYVGGTFEVVIRITKEYPFSAPGVKFKTPIFHCNISSDGYLCVDFLQDKWIPSLSLCSMVDMIKLLLASPNPDSPLNCDAANLMRESLDKHDRHARLHTQEYAGGPGLAEPKPGPSSESSEVVGGGGGGADAGPDVVVLESSSDDEAVDLTSSPSERRGKRGRDDEGDDGRPKRMR